MWCVCTTLPAGFLKWDIDRRVFEKPHRYMGIKPNPLYSQAMGPSSCMALHQLPQG